MHFACDKNEHQVHATRHSGATIGFKHSDLWTDIIVLILCIVLAVVAHGVSTLMVLALIGLVALARLL